MEISISETHDGRWEWIVVKDGNKQAGSEQQTKREALEVVIHYLGGMVEEEKEREADIWVEEQRAKRKRKEADAETGEDLDKELRHWDYTFRMGEKELQIHHNGLNPPHYICVRAEDNSWNVSLIRDFEVWLASNTTAYPKPDIVGGTLIGVALGGFGR